MVVEYRFRTGINATKRKSIHSINDGTCVPTVVPYFTKNNNIILINVVLRNNVNTQTASENFRAITTFTCGPVGVQ